MAKVVVTLKIMPESPDTPLDEVQASATKEITSFGGEVGKVEVKPVAFGLKQILLYFVMDEAKGTTEPLEEKIRKIAGVASVDVIDVRRAIG